jgi:hypothetical protein
MQCTEVTAMKMQKLKETSFSAGWNNSKKQLNSKR